MNIKRRENKRSLCLSAGIFLILGVLIYSNGASRVEAAIAGHVVINEIQTDSISGTGGSTDDFVELYNPTLEDIVLDGWSLQKQSSASTSVIYKTNLSGVIAAGGYFLIVRNDADTNQSLKDMADILTSSTFSISSGNVVYLVSNDTNIDNQEDTDIVDYVGMGISESFEGVAAAVNPSETKSISRLPDGEDSDENSVDFVMMDVPSPENTASGGDSDLSGTVLVTISPSSPAEQNIGPSSAGIVFAVNSDGLARVNYGLDSGYGSASADTVIVANAETSIDLSDLDCGTSYHYSIYAENVDNSDNYATADASFTTLPCGISIDSITMTKASARANDDYFDGWAWDFDITVWDFSETSLKMKFEQWTGDASLDAGANMQFSVNGMDWIDISTNDTYSILGADISTIDEDPLSLGRQVNIQVQMKVPVGTLAGFYNSNYGILTE